MAILSKTSFASLLALTIAAINAQSGTGVTTRYWDCCKPSCSWNGKAAVSSPVRTCDNRGTTLYSPDIRSGCDGGSAFTCTDNAPWAVNDDLAYGFAAVSLSGSSEAQWCCECYELTFTSGPVNGKKMIIQATNTGGDLGSNHFDILMPGGGVGIFNGCPAQFGSWNGGAQYGGVSSRSQCDQLPAQVREGCYWRFDWFKGADNPAVSWKKTACPAALTQKTGCVRNDAPVAPPPPPPVTPSTSLRISTSSSASSSTRPSTTSTTSTRSSTTSSSTSTSRAVSTPVIGGPTVGMWGQCGGINYTGPKTCVAGAKCTYLNDWYYQCL